MISHKFLLGPTLFSWHLVSSTWVDDAPVDLCTIMEMFYAVEKCSSFGSGEAIAGSSPSKRTPQ